MKLLTQSSFLQLFFPKILLLALVASWLPTSTVAVQSQLLSRLTQYYGDYEPTVIIDIGANKGDWAKAARAIYPKTKIFMLEASPHQEAGLKKVAAKIGNAEYKIGVLSGKSGDTVKFYQGGDTGNSMFQERSKHYKDQVPVERITTTLDDEIKKSVLLNNGNNNNNNNNHIDIIKADVQGAELVVFEGATSALEQATFVQFEASTVEYNAGAACLHEVDAFLRSKGFVLYDYGDPSYQGWVYGTYGVGQFDIMYIKPTSSRLPNYIKENNPTYCGVGNGIGAPSSSSSAATGADTGTSRKLKLPRNAGEAALLSKKNQGIPVAMAWLFGCGCGAMMVVVFNRLVDRKRKKRSH